MRTDTHHTYLHLTHAHLFSSPSRSLSENGASRSEIIVSQIKLCQIEKKTICYLGHKFPLCQIEFFFANEIGCFHTSLVDIAAPPNPQIRMRGARPPSLSEEAGRVIGAPPASRAAVVFLPPLIDAR